MVVGGGGGCAVEYDECIGTADSVFCSCSLRSLGTSSARRVFPRDFAPADVAARRRRVFRPPFGIPDGGPTAVAQGPLGVLPPPSLSLSWLLMPLNEKWHIAIYQATMPCSSYTGLGNGSLLPLGVLKLK